MRRLAAALVAAAGLALPASAGAQSYVVPFDNPFVGQPGAAPEVWAYGFRNPYRFSFDRQSGGLVVGDVGSGPVTGREEVNVVGRGQNFGWPCREGTGAGAQSCTAPGAVDPVFSYPTGNDAAIIGGFVVRDPALPASFQGRYLFTDLYETAVHSIRLDAANPDDQTLGAGAGSPSSFGEDALGRIYLTSLSGGDVFRIVPDGAGGVTTQSVGVVSAPMYVAAPPGDIARVFVVERAGALRVIQNGNTLTEPFLDISDDVTLDGERGMQSVAFAPDFTLSRKLYVFYTNSEGDARIDEFKASAGDPNRVEAGSRRSVLAVEHSAESNHYGGQLQFGPDCYLYASIGDGGSQGDVERDAQNLGNLYGKILRIDPDPRSTSAACADAEPPALFATAKRRQRVLALGGAIAYGSCSEACRLTVTGRLRIGRRGFTLRKAIRAAAANRRVRLPVRLTRRARKSLRRAVLNGRRPKVRLAVRAQDGAGNATPLVRRAVRVRR